MNKKKIVVTPGDGIGPEVSEQALIILKEVATRFQLELEVEEMPVGGTEVKGKIHHSKSLS